MILILVEIILSKLFSLKLTRFVFVNEEMEVLK